VSGGQPPPDFREARAESLALLSRAGIALTPEEAAAFEVADFGLGRLRELGLQLVTYINWRLPPPTLHWFQAGEGGRSSASSRPGAWMSTTSGRVRRSGGGAGGPVENGLPIYRLAASIRSWSLR
jgi:hypothetical protein